MKPETSEKILVETLFRNNVDIPKSAKLIVSKLTGDASTRKYYRVESPSESYVCCLDEPIEIDGEENKFVQAQRVFEKYGVRVPKVHKYVPKKGFILEEDLGDETLLKKLSKITDIEEENRLYQRSIDQLLKIHEIDPDKYGSVGDFSQSFDLEKLNFENQLTKKYFIETFLGHKLVGEEEKIIDKAMNEVISNLQEEKFVLAHRDYHSRNIMMKEDELIIIDFQDARRGLPQYDLVSLLDDCYYQLERSDRYGLIKSYYENSRISQEQGSFDRFMELYDLMTIQRTYKAIGSFSYIYDKRQDERYLKYIGYSFEKLRNVLKRHRSLDSLRKILSSIYYEY